MIYRYLLVTKISYFDNRAASDIVYAKARSLLTQTQLTLSAHKLISKGGNKLEYVGSKIRRTYHIPFSPKQANPSTKTMRSNKTVYS